MAQGRVTKLSEKDIDRIVYLYKDMRVGATDIIREFGIGTKRLKKIIEGRGVVWRGNLTRQRSKPWWEELNND